MTKLFPTILSVMIGSLLSCNRVESKKVTTVKKDESIHSEIKGPLLNKVFTIDRAAITRDYTTWYNYTYYNVRLSQDFIGLDVDSLKIDKLNFLNKLLAGNVVAFKIKILEGEPVYKLYKLNSKDASIRATIQQLASTEIQHSKMEGTVIPEFNFVDLNGKTYDRSSTKGKIIVLKCWFIHCIACVREFPECNKLVDDNKDRNDILFISLAMDSKEDLTKFLKTRELKYAVIPKMDDYMAGKLKITEYPTHLLVDNKGKILKVVNTLEDLIPFLKKETRPSTL